MRARVLPDIIVTALVAFLGTPVLANADDQGDERLRDIVTGSTHSGAPSVAVKARKPQPIAAPLSSRDAIARLDGTSRHPQLVRARALIDEAMRQKYGLDWRINGRTPEAPQKTRAVAQATTEYQRYYQIARALQSLLPIRRSEDAPKATANDLLSGRLAPQFRPPADPCSDIARLTQPPRATATQVDLIVPGERRTGPTDAGTLATSLGLSGPHVKGCAAAAQRLAAEAKALQRMFGALPEWPAFDVHWITPASRTAPKRAAPPRIRPTQKPSSKPRWIYVGH